MRKNVWRGWVIDKSLKNKSVLSKLKIVKSETEENMEGDEKQVWQLYTVDVEDKEIGKIAKLLEKKIKLTYYAHFTDGQTLIIIFSGKTFSMKLSKAGKENKYGITYFRLKPENKKIWRSAFEYGVKKGKVDSRYLIKVE